MTSQVLAFLRPRQRTPDWSSEEIAELYRIEHALAQARLSVQTDRGVTDEGDPWFVFCRADGEVLVHIARFDSEYRLYGSGLPGPLTGRNFRDLARSFVDRIPLQVPTRRSDGPQLFVHPAAMLAIIIGSLFVAYDDVYFGGPGGDTAQALALSDRADDAVPKLGLQAAVQKYVNSFLGLTSAPANHESAYLNVMAAIGAVIVGAAVSADGELSSGPLIASAGGGDAHPKVDPGTPVILDTASLWTADSFAAGTRFDRSVLPDSHELLAVAQDTGAWQATSGAPPTALVAEFTTPRQEADDASAPAFSIGRPHADASAVEANAEVGRIPFVVAEAGQQFVPAAAASTMGSSGSADFAAKISTSVPILHAATSSEPASGFVSGSIAPGDLSFVEQLLQHLPKGAPIAVAAEQSVLAAIVPAVHLSDASTTGASIGDPVVKPFQHFDDNAQLVLIRFLQDNPSSIVFFEHKDVIVYDGNQDPNETRPMTVQVWEFDGGATIALVGHADQPGHALI